MRTRLIFLAAAAVGVGCDSPKTYPFGGEWETSGALTDFFVQATQTGQQVGGTLSGPASTGVGGQIFGTDANGTVSFTFAYGGQTFDGTNGVSYEPGSWQFTGHFVSQNEVSGLLTQNGHTASLTLTRMPR